MKLAFFEAPVQEKEADLEKGKKIRDIFKIVGVSIEDYGDIFDRIKEMHAEENSHFSDAVEIMCMVEKMFDRIGGEIGKEKVMLAALLHDIGKSGPDDADPVARETVQTLFAKDAEKKYAIDNFPERTVREAVEIIYKDESGKRLEALAGCGVDAGWGMREFFGMHADWTYDILRNNASEQVDDTVATIAATHHILEGKNPAHVDKDAIPQEAKFLEMMDKYYFLTLLDKYQAFRKRSGMEHEEAVRIIKEKITSSMISEREKMRYHELVDLVLNEEMKNILESAREEAKNMI